MPEDLNTPSESNFVVAAERQVKSLIQAAKWNKFYIRILGVVCIIIILGCAVLGAVVNQEINTTQELRQESINSCQAGNEFKTEQTQIWAYFIGQLLKNDKKPQDIAEGAAILKVIDHIDAPRNCIATYSNSGNTAKP